MPIRRVRRARKPRRVPRRGRKVARRGRKSVKQIARIVETIDFTDINPGVNYNFNFNLSQFLRASQLAPNFKWYKAAKVTWTLEPLYNTFQDGTTGGEVSMPYMYSVMNRTQDNTILNLNDFQAMGCKPVKLTTKKVMAYRPNWCSAGLNAQLYDPITQNYRQTPQLGLKAQYSYLASPRAVVNFPTPTTVAMQPAAPDSSNTSGLIGNVAQVWTNAVVYNGHSVLIDQAVSTGFIQPVCKVVATVEWHFKDPQCSYAPFDPSKAQTVQPATAL